MKLRLKKTAWYSKTIALAIFIVWPFIFFYFGVVYGAAVQRQADRAENAKSVMFQY